MLLFRVTRCERPIIALVQFGTPLGALYCRNDFRLEKQTNFDDLIS